MRRALLLLAVLVVAAFASGALAAEEAEVDAIETPSVEAAAPSKGADAGAPEREAFTHKVRANAKQFTFQAEVNRLMDILIHSLYTNRDIFLRELISNASDALDKIRFLALTNKSVLGEGEAAALDIRIWADKPSRTLFIRDRGVGMTQEELVSNLGTIAKSGTSAFLESLQRGGDVSLIGQFGVGFYSVYLVADWVEVVSKATGGKQHIWASGADGAFSVAEDEGENEDLGRGTLIKIHLKEGAEEYADQERLRGLVARHSEFINFPIYLQTTTEKDVPIEGDAEAEAGGAGKDEAREREDESTEDDDDDEGEVIDEDDDDEGEGEANPKTERRNVTEWAHLNGNKAIWLRSPGDVTADEYGAFYKAVSRDLADPLAHIHFKAEGDVEFKALLFIPATAPWDFYDSLNRPKKAGGAAGAGLKLYVRRVFISDDADELLPRWLSFLRGVVDSDSLPLNVNREALQAHSSLKTMRKKLVRKALDTFKRLADDEAACQDGAKEGSDKPSEEACKRFGSLWKEFGRALKLGVMEEQNNKLRLAKLLRFASSKSGEGLTSLDAYVGRMQEGQQAIYYIAGLSKEEVAASPFAEKLVAQGKEVLFLTDVLDEYVMQALPEFDDHRLVNIAKDDLDEGKGKEAAAASKAAAKAQREAFKPLTAWWKEQLGGKVTGVKLSKRLAATPAVVVAAKWGQSANMERIMRASAFGDPARAAMMKGQRTLEINPDHPLILGLKDAVAEGASAAPEAAAAAALLYDAALLESGFEPDEPKAFAGRLYGLVKAQLGVQAELPAPGGGAASAAAPAGESSSSGSSGAKGKGEGEAAPKEAEPEEEGEGQADDEADRSEL